MSADLYQLAAGQCDKARAHFATTAALLDAEMGLRAAIAATPDPDLAAWLAALLPSVQLHRCLADGAYHRASASAEALSAAAEEAA